MIRRNRLFTMIGLAAFLAVFSRPACAGEDIAASTGTPHESWYGTAWRHARDTVEQGRLELYVPVYTLHMPYAYTQAELRSYNDIPWGGGLGEGRYNASGTWEGFYALDFQDSHSRPEYLGGYGWVPTWHPLDPSFRLGAGLIGFITARADLRRYTPFPGVLPLGSVGYRFLDLEASFIPGGKGDGNVMFFVAKFSFYGASRVQSMRTE